jgi:signal peptidase I
VSLDEPGAHRDAGRRVVAFLVSLLVPGTGQLVFAHSLHGVAWFVLCLLAILSMPVSQVIGLAVFVGARLPAALLAAFTPRSRILYPPWRRVALGWSAMFGFAALFWFAVESSYLADVAVEGATMAPTLLPGDRVVVAKAVYAVRLPFAGTALARPAEPAAGDLVMLRRSGRHACKRVIGVAGDKVAIRGGLVHVNGIPAPQSHALIADDVPEDFLETEVPPGQLFVLSDDRRTRDDSRSFGPVRAEDVVGKVSFVWWSRDAGGAVRWGRVGTSLR